MWDRIDLKMRGKSNFMKNYWPAVLVSLITMLVMVKFTHRYTDDGFWHTGIEFEHLRLNWTAIRGSSDFLGRMGILGGVAAVLDIFLFQVLLVGADRFYVENRDYNAPVSKLLFSFQNGYYGNAVLVMFIKNLYTFLWSLLLIIPGIVKSYAYRMVPYILAEQPDISYRDAIRISQEMMYGQKLDTFILDLSFIGWTFAAALTCGIAGVFYVKPYVDATNAELYAALRGDWFAKNAGN